VGNKCDLGEKRVSSQQTADDYCPPINAEHYYETSARTGLSAKKLFEDIAENSKLIPKCKTHINNSNSSTKQKDR
jgi:hypothetical protein